MHQRLSSTGTVAPTQRARWSPHGPDFCGGGQPKIIAIATSTCNYARVRNREIVCLGLEEQVRSGSPRRHCALGILGVPEPLGSSAVSYLQMGYLSNCCLNAIAFELTCDGQLNQSRSYRAKGQDSVHLACCNRC
jgi:hypothetical protein